MKVRKLGPPGESIFLDNPVNQEFIFQVVSFHTEAVAIYCYSWRHSQEICVGNGLGRKTQVWNLKFDICHFTSPT